MKPLMLAGRTQGVIRGSRMEDSPDKRQVCSAPLGVQSALSLGVSALSLGVSSLVLLVASEGCSCEGCSLLRLGSFLPREE